MAGRAAADLTARQAVVWVLLLAAFVVLFVWAPVQPVRIPSESMSPTLRAGDHVLLDRRASEVSRGDVVAFARDGGPTAVKRVVATGGEQVSVEDGVLHVDGAPVAEPHVDLRLQDGVFYGPVVVPPDAVFLLGDHRLNSADSREFGPVPRSSIVGEVAIRLWPNPGRL